MSRCEYCEYRNSWDCEDGWNRVRDCDFCDRFKLDWNTLRWSQQKAIQKILMETTNF